MTTVRSIIPLTRPARTSLGQCAPKYILEKLIDAINIIPIKIE